jgi:hypothetical protein
MVAEAKADYPSWWAAIGTVAQKLGIGSTETVRESTGGGSCRTRPGLPADQAAAIRRPKRGNAELRQPKARLRDGWHAEVDGMAAAVTVGLCKLVGGSGEADFEFSDLAEPALALGLADAGDEVVADGGDAVSRGGVGPEH